MIDKWIVILARSTLLDECEVEAVNHLGSKFILAFNEIPQTTPLLFLYTNKHKSDLVNISRSESSLGSRVHVMSLSLSKQQVQIVRMNQSQIPYPQKDVGSHGCLVLESNTLFGIHVVIKGLDWTVASYLALPLMAFGRRYYLITLQSKVYVTAISATETLVKFRFHSVPPELHNLIYNDKLFTRNNLFIVSLKSLEAFTISTCSHNVIDPNFSLTGSLVESEFPMAVITGTCRHVTKHQNCSQIETYPDISIEMMYPQYSFGQLFIVFTIMHRKTSDTLVVLATLPKTNVTINSALSIFIKEAGSYKYLDIVNKTNQLVESSKPVMLSLILTSSCNNEEDPGGSSISTILPVTLWFTVFTWRTPPLRNVIHYMVLVSFEVFVQEILINHRLISKDWCQVQVVKSKAAYFTYTCPIPTNRSIHVESDRAFACYFYGIGMGSYLSPGGFHRTEAAKLECIYSDPTPGDKIDNDCDGVADEEVIDYKDNDEDGLCDEDFQASDKSRNFTWGPNCSERCTGCQHVCSPIDGYCDSCRAGYKGHWSGCQSQCEEDEYGANCKGDCYEKCGTNCLNRENGQCPGWSIFYVILHYGYPYLVILASIGSIHYCLCQPRKKTYGSPEKEMDSTKTNSLTSGRL